MAAVATPTQLTYSPAPKAGILLNPYPTGTGLSPRMTPQAQSLPLPDSPAIRYSAPNTPNMHLNGRSVPLPRTDSRSSSNSGADGSVSANGGQNGNHSRTSSMRIRFAPLPDPRKLEEAEYLESPLVNTNLPLPATDDTISASPTTPGSQYSHVSANSALSAGSASLFAYSASDDGRDTSETVSDQGIMSTISSATKKKSKRWSKTLFKPLLKSTSMTSSGHQSDDAMWRTNSRDSFQSATSNDGLGLSRRMTTESAPRPSSAGNGATATQLTRVQSAGMGPGRSRKNTKMLNGRVYGAKSTAAAAFQNIRDEEPAFVEWGHGGAGSVNNHSGGAENSKYAGVQSGSKVSIGAVSAGHAAIEDEEDDGGSLAWLRKRKKERAEKEAKAREEAERAARETEVADGANTTEAEAENDASASTPGPMSPQLTDDAQVQARNNVPERKSSMTIERVSPRQAGGTPVLGALPSSVLVSPSTTGPHTPAATTTTDEHHIIQAINLPASPPAHAHAHAHAHGSHEGENHGSPPAVITTAQQHQQQMVAEPLAISPSSKSSTDSDSDSGDDDDDDEREDEESETEEEEAAEKEQRKTSVCAGVEKVSRHKELEQQ